jgi:hypothetical protein
MMPSKQAVFRIVIGACLTAIQLILTPYLAYAGRRGNIHALLPDPVDQFLLCVLVFVAAMIASYRTSSVGKLPVLWSCCIRGTLWAAILTLFFFEVVCCSLLRFDQVPPSNDLHINAVIVFFGLVWFLSFYILLFGERLLKRFLTPGPIPKGSES